MDRKILTLLSFLGVAFIFGANADVFNKIGFETPFSPGAFNYHLDDEGQDTQSAIYSGNGTYWSFTNTASSASATASDDALYEIVAFGTGDGEVAAPDKKRPDAFDGQTNENFLEVDTSTQILYRNIKTDQADTPIDSGIYLDTMVQFTGAEVAPTLESREKLAVWLKSVEADEAGNEPGETNLIVTAGYLSSTSTAIVMTNYVMTSATAIEENTWYRLTIQSIENMGNGYVGFVVYLDGQQLCYAGDVAIGDDKKTASISSNIKRLYYSDTDPTKRGLVPSLFGGSGSAVKALKRVGLKGTGRIDDIVWTPDAPSFIPNDREFTLALTEGVSSVTYTLDDKEYTITETTNIVYDTSSISVTLNPDNIVYDTAEGWQAGGIEAKDTLAYEYDDTTYTYTVTGTGTITVKAMKGEDAAYAVGDVSYSSFEDALDAARTGTEDAPATIKLLDDVTRVLQFKREEDAEADLYVILDLAGKTIKSDSEYAPLYVADGVHLTVTNSTEQIGAIIDSGIDESDGFSMSIGGEVVIYGGYINCPLNIDGGEVALCGGYYIAESVYDEGAEREEWLADIVNPIGVSFGELEKTYANLIDFDNYSVTAEEIATNNLPVLVTSVDEATEYYTYIAVKPRDVPRTDLSTLTVKTYVAGGEASSTRATGSDIDVEIKLFADEMEVDESNYEIVWSPETICEPGEYVATITAMPDSEGFKGETNVTFVVEAALIDLASATVAFDPVEQTYDGTALALPAVTVSIGDKTLAETTDYTFAWTYDDAPVSEIAAAGDYTVTITAAQDSETYTGSKTATYTVASAVPQDPTVDGETVAAALVFTKATTRSPIVYPSSPVISGEPGSQTIAYNGVTVNVPKFYTATLDADGKTVTLELNEFAKPIIAETPASGSQEAIPALEIGETTVIVGLVDTYGETETCHALYYGLADSGTVAGTSTDEGNVEGYTRLGEPVKGTGGSLKLTTAKDASQTAHFYRAYATDIAPTSGD